MKKIAVTLLLTLALLLPQTAFAWNSTGHETVAGIAWDNMTDKAKQNVIALLLAAPQDACLRNLFSNDSRPLAAREREFFILAATWPDIIRPKDENDQRQCIKYHQGDWHFVDYFWTGTSGSATDPPRNLPQMKVAKINAVERLVFLRSAVVGTKPKSTRAMYLAWILHLVGDIHQPLHTSGRVTNAPGEKQGDQGGNLFKLGKGKKPLKLHSFWDQIVDRSIKRGQGQSLEDYLDKVIRKFENDFPQSDFSGTLASGQFDIWRQESLQLAQDEAYPADLKRGQMPSDAYRRNAFLVSEESIAAAGYRLADLLNKLFG